MSMLQIRRLPLQHPAIHERAVSVYELWFEKGPDTQTDDLLLDEVEESAATIPRICLPIHEPPVFITRKFGGVSFREAIFAAGLYALVNRAINALNVEWQKMARTIHDMIAHRIQKGADLETMNFDIYFDPLPEGEIQEARPRGGKVLRISSTRVKESERFQREKEVTWFTILPASLEYRVHPLDEVLPGFRGVWTSRDVLEQMLLPAVTSLRPPARKKRLRVAHTGQVHVPYRASDIEVQRFLAGLDLAQSIRKNKEIPGLPKPVGKESAAAIVRDLVAFGREFWGDHLPSSLFPGLSLQHMGFYVPISIRTGIPDRGIEIEPAEPERATRILVMTVFHRPASTTRVSSHVRITMTLSDPEPPEDRKRSSRKTRTGMARRDG